ncbi:PASTA domain-containing protein [Adlercreutzia sp. ZJ304]|uniref:PASTA domain-containing protein n=1 Tax=Adlercreutzia sp. ZJ304 TaxID=2709791 RepID=UPI0013EBBC99|nr:PASTA domain-containing protein [Adlercreutzia sp. ZJ304]
MICPNCQTPNRSAAKYCDECGYELPSVKPTATVREPFAANYEDDNFENADTIDLNSESLTIDEGFIPTVSFDDNENDIFSSDAITLLTLDDFEDDFEESNSNAPTKPIESNDAPSSPNLLNEVASRDYRIDENPPVAAKRKHHFSGKKFGIILAILALLIAAAVAVTYFAQFWGGRVVPDVSGMSQVDATYAIQESGFGVQIEEVISDEVEGIVLSSDPVAGTRAPEKTTVTLRISIARFIPDVVGKPLEEAESLMREAGFTNYEITYKKSNEKTDTVLSVNPDASTRAKADARITIEVAEPFRVPDVSGKTKDEAQAALEAEGYSVSTQQYNTEDAPEGQVVKTDPEAGSPLNSGSKVVVYIAHNRSSELIQLTKDFFNNTPAITMNGSLYEMSKVNNVTFEGGNTCKFSITVRPIQTVTWFGTQTETRYGNYEVVDGSIVWTDSNQISSIEPPIKQGS